MHRLVREITGCWVEEQRIEHPKVCPLQPLWHEARCLADIPSLHLKQEFWAIFTELQRELNGIHRYQPHNTIYTTYEYFIPGYLYKNVCRANSLEKIEYFPLGWRANLSPSAHNKNTASLRGKGWMDFSAAPYNMGSVLSTVLFRGHRQTTPRPWVCSMSSPPPPGSGGQGDPRHRWCSDLLLHPEWWHPFSLCRQPCVCILHIRNGGRLLISCKKGGVSAPSVLDTQHKHRHLRQKGLIPHCFKLSFFFF